MGVRTRTKKGTCVFNWQSDPGAVEGLVHHHQPHHVGEQGTSDSIDRREERQRKRESVVLGGGGGWKWAWRTVHEVIDLHRWRKEL